MQSPGRLERPPALIRRSRVLLLRTKAVESLTGPVSLFEAAATSLENRYDGWIQARQQARVAMRAQHEAERQVDHELRGVALTILTVDHGRRSSEIYRRYFPDGYGSVLGLPADGVAVVAAGVLAAMTDETNAEILRWRDPMTTACTALEGAVSAQRAAAAAAGQEKALLEEEKLSWRKALNTFYFAARTILSDQRGYVESLFGVDGNRPPAETPAPPEPSPPTPTPEQNTTVAVHAAAS